MVINVTEQQKKVIESQGYMVIEFKAWVEKMLEWFRKWSGVVLDIWNMILDFLEQMKILRHCEKAVKEFAVCLELLVKPIDNLKIDCFKEPKVKYPFIRSIGMKCQPNFSNKVVYHRCRDRC